MKYKFKTEIETEINIELPYYFKIENSHMADSYFAIISENLAICNWKINDITSLNCPQVITKFIDKGKQITSAEFKTAITQSCNHLINLI
jgi:hypothetical protein